jgi:hypothetical protein
MLATTAVHWALILVYTVTLDTERQKQNSRGCITIHTH